MPLVLPKGDMDAIPSLVVVANREDMTDRRHVPPSARNIAMRHAVRREV